MKATENKDVSALTEALTKTINNKLLKHAAGYHIFCQNCQNILDWKTVVIFEASKGGKNATVVVCNKCFNPEGVANLVANGYETEITSYKK